MKVKIFVGINAKSVEDAVNEFIKDKSIIDIKYQSIGLTIRYNVTVYDRALVMYVDEE